MAGGEIDLLKKPTWPLLVVLLVDEVSIQLLSEIYSPLTLALALSTIYTGLGHTTEDTYQYTEVPPYRQLSGCH